MLPVCVVSGQAFWPPSPMSPFITSGAVEWREVSPFGTLVGLVVYRRLFQRALESLTPYGVGLVALDAGPRLMAHLPAPDDPQAARSADRVRVAFAPLLEGGPAVPTLVRLTSRNDFVEGTPK